jgi:hypothetical protein
MKIEYYHVGGQLMANVIGNAPEHRSIWHISWGWDELKILLGLAHPKHWVPDDIQ